jgi:hypothetical protein
MVSKHEKSDYNFRHNRLIFFRGVGRDRTADTRIFSPLLYRLSYRTILAFGAFSLSPPIGGLNGEQK